MFVQRTEVSSRLNGCNFYKLEDEFFQKVRKFLAQFSKMNIQPSTFSKKCAFSKILTRRTEYNIDKQAERLSFESQNYLVGGREHSKKIFQ